MRYLPHTPGDVQCMMEALDIDDIEQLFKPIPEPVRLDRPLDLPPSLSEPELDS